ncbi:MAG: DPP IV N-terminal domain-containing protein [Clostridium sp.]|uniref:DPP IV N-terminal domain-containing protein n=1 Tax=Clostridium sp. TaxID=1506 RepID=UPI0025B7CBF7|nr:DPP IV N-terminal domain-containing protein [Clostridium sp.]MCE5221739.1 DPP IV N-terminal domain-containing protein [Clostridium sp.]
MKASKKIIAWAILSIILQVGVLYILDNFVFKHSSDFRSKKIEIQKDKTKDINATIPTGAETINVSYDGKYLTYNENNNLYIQDTKTGTNTKITTESECNILYYKWFSDRDRLIIAKKVEKNGESKIQLVTYNPQNSNETAVSNICTYQEDMEVKKVSESTITGVYYVDIYKGGLKNTVYRIDINETLTKLSLQTNVLGNMQVIPHEDRLIYEDTVNSKFFATSPNKQLTFNSNKKLTLLGIDRKDVIYMGELNGDKVASIVYGKISEDTSTWKKVTLDSVVSSEDLYFSNDSEILINDNLKGSVKNLTTGNEIEYEGKLIQIKEDFIATMDSSGKLVYKNFKSQNK